MKRTYADLWVYLAVILLVALYWATGWKAAVAPPRPFLPGLAAALILGVNAVLLYLTNDRVMNEMSLIAPVAYAVLATANPAALYYTPLHAAALLMAVSLFFYLHFCAEKPSLDYLGGAWVSLGAAGLLYPPLLWLAPVYAATMAPRAESKGKYWVTLLLSLILPAAIHIGIQYIRGGDPFDVVLRNLWGGMTAVSHPSLHLSAATLVRILLTFVAAVLAALQMLRRLTHFKTGQFHAVIRVLLLSVCLAVLAGIFLNDSGQPFGILLMLPVSLILNEYLRNPDNARGVRTLTLILLLVLAVERISRFV